MSIKFKKTHFFGSAEYLFFGGGIAAVHSKTMKNTIFFKKNSQVERYDPNSSFAKFLYKTD